MKLVHLVGFIKKKPSEVVSLRLRSMEIHFNIAGQHNRQTNIIEPLRSVLERMVRSRLPPLSLRQLEEECYSIPLESIQNVYENIPRKVQAVLQADGGSPPYL